MWTNYIRLSHKMLCDFLDFLGPCFLLLDLREETCISQCRSLGRILPSYDTVRIFINEISQLKKPTLEADAVSASEFDVKNPAKKGFDSKLKWRFPVAVDYDFQHNKWIDSYSGHLINELKWASGYPHLNDVLVFGVINSKSQGKYSS